MTTQINVGYFEAIGFLFFNILYGNIKFWEYNQKLCYQNNMFSDNGPTL